MPATRPRMQPPPLDPRDDNQVATTVAPRPRKTLPPLSPAPGADASPSPPPLPSSSSSSSPSPTALVPPDMEPSPQPHATKAEVEHLLRQHGHFARAFKLNDPAKLLPFLDPGVTLCTSDGILHDGANAVLGCLVGAKMSKRSSLLHIKTGRPSRTGPWQTTFIYEHGLVFRRPTYAEILEWHPQTGLIRAITHADLQSLEPAMEAAAACASASNNARSTTVDNQFNGDNDAATTTTTLPPPVASAATAAVVESLKAACEDNPSHCPYRRQRSSMSRTRSSSSSSSSVASQSAKVTAAAPVSTIAEYAVTRVAVLTRLVPVRKRKLVNPFVTLETVSGRPIWRSSVAERQAAPVWSVAARVVLPEDEERIVATLWDHGLFRNIRVAAAAFVLSQRIDADDPSAAVDVHLQLVALPGNGPSADALGIELAVTLEPAHTQQQSLWPQYRRSSGSVSSSLRTTTKDELVIKSSASVTTTSTTAGATRTLVSVVLLALVVALVAAALASPKVGLYRWVGTEA